MRFRIPSRAVSALLVAMSMAACGDGQPVHRSDDGPIRILSVAGYTGLLSSPANAVRRGMQAAVDDVNSSGGVKGRLLELTTQDNQSDVQRGLTLIQKSLFSDVPPDLVVPGVSSAEALAVAPLLSRRETVGLGATSSGELNDPEKFPFYFSQSSSQEPKLAVISDHLEKLNVKKVAIVVAADAMGEATVDALSGDLEQAGIAFEVFSFPADAVDTSPQFSAARASDPDMIYMDGAGGQVAQILAGRVKAGAEGIPTLGGTSMPLLPIFELTKGTRQLDNVTFAYEPGSVWVKPEQRTSAFNAFDAAVRSQGELEMPLSTYGFGWDIVQTFVAAMENAPADRHQDAVRRSLETLPAGVTDRLVLYKTLFTPRSHQVQPAPGDIRIGRPLEERDWQYVIETAVNEAPAASR